MERLGHTTTVVSVQLVPRCLLPNVCCRATSSLSNYGQTRQCKPCVDGSRTKRSRRYIYSSLILVSPISLHALDRSQLYDCQVIRVEWLDHARQLPGFRSLTYQLKLNQGVIDRHKVTQGLRKEKALEQLFIVTRTILAMFVGKIQAVHKRRQGSLSFLERGKS